MTAAMPSLLMAAPGAGVVRGGRLGDGWPGSAGEVVVMCQIYRGIGRDGWRFSDASGQDPANVRGLPFSGLARGYLSTLRKPPKGWDPTPRRARERGPGMVLQPRFGNIGIYALKF
ncbi:hypothetical protein NtRootD5_04070 [Arthrobacter sp. NtRootD5]|nr:hypothetical protein NtRootA2_04050 [Arthrobacter sp. NtRootA2]BCW30076.1 hypothetical protein NtRootD5_04070 [Arthrobacter sp. NtRootD5]